MRQLFVANLGGFVRGGPGFSVKLSHSLLGSAGSGVGAFPLSVRMCVLSRPPIVRLADEPRSTQSAQRSGVEKSRPAQCSLSLGQTMAYTPSRLAPRP